MEDEWIDGCIFLPSLFYAARQLLTVSLLLRNSVTSSWLDASATSAFDIGALLLSLYDDVRDDEINAFYLNAG